MNITNLCNKRRPPIGAPQAHVEEVQPNIVEDSVGDKVASVSEVCEFNTDSIVKSLLNFEQNSLNRNIRKNIKQKKNFERIIDKKKKIYKKIMSGRYKFQEFETQMGLFGFPDLNCNHNHKVDDELSEKIDSLLTLLEGLKKGVNVTMDFEKMGPGYMRSVDVAVSSILSVVANKAEEFLRVDLEKPTLINVLITVTTWYCLWRLFKYGCKTVLKLLKNVSFFFGHFFDRFELQDNVEKVAENGMSSLIKRIFGIELKTKDLVKFVLNFKRHSENCKSFFEFAKDTLTEFVNLIRTQLLGLNGFDTTSDLQSAISSWIREVRDWQIKEARNELDVNYPNYEALKALKVRGRVLQSKYDGKGKEFDNIKVAIRATQMELEKLFDQFRKKNFEKSHLRHKPLTIVLKGSSGVGKSAATVPLLNAILVRTIKTKEELKLFKENSDSFIYSRAAETGFWDGYVGQKAVVYDDFMQADENKVSGSVVNEPFEIVRASNMFPYLLWMAHLDNKGTNYFDARIILCSTNNWNLSTEVIKEKEALERRFDVEASVYPKVQYCKPGTANSELRNRRLQNPSEFTTDVYEFHVGDKILMFDEMVDLCVQKYLELDECGNSFDEVIKEMKDVEIDRRTCELDTDEQFFETQDDILSLAMEQVKGERSVVEKIFQTFQKYLDVLIEGFSHVQQKVVEFLKKYPMLTIFASLASAFSLYKVFETFTKMEDVFGVQSYDLVKHNKTEKTKQHRKFAAKPVTFDLNYLQDDFIPTEGLQQIENSVLRRNFYVLQSVQTGRRHGHALAICGQKFILNAHYFDTYRTNYGEAHTNIRFVPIVSWMAKNELGSVEVDVQKLLQNEPTAQMRKHDLWIVDLGQICRPHRDIVSLFVEKQYLQNFKENMPYRFCRLSDDHTSMQRISGVSQISQVSCDGAPLVTVGVPYEVPTVKGDCGSILFLGEDSNHGNIIGFHVAGNGIAGFASLVTREVLLEHLGDTYECQSNIQLYDPLFCKLEHEVEVFDNGLLEAYNQDIGYAIRVERNTLYYLLGHYQFGCLTPAVNIARKSKLKTSTFNGCFKIPYEHLRYPAIMHSVDGLDPYDIALERYSTPDSSCDSRIVDYAVKDYQKLLLDLSRSTTMVYTFETAISGIEGDKYFNSLNRKTSPGFPWSKFATKPGKKSYFGGEGEYTFDSNECILLRQRVEHVLRSAKCGIRSLHLYSDSLKDELRSLDKIRKLSTRLISGAPLDYVICVRMYFGDFCRQFMHNRIYNGSAVGINPYGDEWGDLANYLLEHGDNMIAGDFSRFDSSQTAQILFAILGIINAWYGDDPEGSKIRGILWQDLVFSRHIHNNDIVEFTHCLPSGHPLTSVVNTMYVNLLIRGCWYLRHEFIHVPDFLSNIRVVAYGDDHVIGLSDYASTIFSYQTLESDMRVMGAFYTDEAKNDIGQVAPHKRIRECTFLKRAFKCTDRWYAPLDLHVLLQIAYWYRKGPNVLQRQLDNIDTMFRELSLHGPEIFSEYVTQFNTYLQTLSYEERQMFRFENLTFEYYFDLVINQNLFESRSPHTSTFSESGESCEEVLDLAVLPYYQGIFKTQGDCAGRVMGDITAFKEPPAAKNNVGSNVETKPTAEGQFSTEQQIIGHTTVLETDKNINTNFDDDAATRHNQPFPIVDMNVSRLLHVGDAYSKDSVKDFLATPVMIRNFNVASTDVANTTLQTVVLPFDSSNLGSGTDVGQGMMLKRLNAYLGFRGTAVVRVQVNCNRFAQGRLLIHYLPGQHTNPDDVKSHRFNLMTKSQNPRCEINLNRDTSTVFKVPYVSAIGAYDLSSTAINTRLGIMGYLYATVYSPLVGTSTLNVSMFLHFEDIELITPSYYPQMNMSDIEQKTGIISAPLKIVSRAIGVLGEIPSLSSIAGTAAWATDALSKCAMAFGYAKPNNETRLVRMSNTKNAYMLNAEGDEDNYKMALSSRNKVDILSNFAGNDIDELSFEYICSRPAWYTTLTWTNASATGTLISTQSLSPASFILTTLIGARDVQTFSPFSFVAKHFAYWRANIVLTFKIVKTEFHTGKLMVVYRPGNFIPGGAVSFNESNFCPREILDIKESDTFVITFPYASLQPFLEWSQVIGYVGLYVLNPLNAPASVSSSVSILLEVSATDVMFSGIADTVMVPVTGSTAVFTPQDDIEPLKEMREKCFVIGNLKANKPDINLSRFCSGEHITSFRQLLQRKVLNRTNVIAASGIKSVTLRPFCNGGSYYNGTSWTDHPLSCDYLSMVNSCYCLSRGSIRCSFYLNVNDNAAVTYAIEPNGISATDYSTSSAQICYPNGLIMQTKSAQTGYVNVEIPHSTYTHSRECEVDFQNVSSSPALGVPKAFVTFSSNGTFANDADFRMQRSIGDDYQLGFFVGVPSLYVYNGTRVF